MVFLCAFSSLWSLLTDNNVQDDGVKALARMLQENTTLKVLNLSGKFHQEPTQTQQLFHRDYSTKPHTGTIVSGECLNAMSDALSLNQTLTRLSFTCEKQKVIRLLVLLVSLCLLLLWTDADRKSEAIRHFKEVLSEKKTPFLFTKL